MTAFNQRFDPRENYYAILDVSVDATREEIVGAYRRLMRESHPDRVRDVSQRAGAEERAKRLNAAYSVLSRPDVRREYDQAMRRTLMAQAVLDRHRTSTVPARPVAPTRTPSESRARRRARRAAVRDAQRVAYRRSLLQVVFAFGGICVLLLALIVVISLLVQGVQLIF